MFSKSEKHLLLKLNEVVKSAKNFHSYYKNCERDIYFYQMCPLIQFLINSNPEIKVNFHKLRKKLFDIRVTLPAGTSTFPLQMKDSWFTTLQERKDFLNHLINTTNACRNNVR